jgi:hypothetical protein
MLSLRRIGVKLEDVEGFADPPDRQEMNRCRDELARSKALDESGDLTEFGRQLSDFESISPFQASAILEVSGQHGSDPLAKCLLTIVILVMANADIVLNPHSEQLRANYCRYSDVVTVTKTLLALVNADVRSLDEMWLRYGLNPAMSTSTTRTVDRLFWRLFGGESEAKLNTRECWTRLIAFAQGIDISVAASALLRCIHVRRPTWVSARRATFSTIVGLREEPAFVFLGDESIAFQDGCGTQVFVSTRPGMVELYAPGDVIICSIQRHAATPRNYGAMIHIDFEKKRDSTEPASLTGQPCCLHPFFSVLVESYLSDRALSTGRRARKRRSCGTPSPPS